MKEGFLFYLIAEVILVFSIIHFALRYKKYRVNYYLVPLIITALGFVGIIFAYLYPANTWLHLGYSGRVLIFIVYAIVLFIVLFYPEIIRYISKRRPKK
jgi:hypothetical protein